MTLTGPRPFGDALMREYRRARMLLVPSLSEGVPKVLCEAMAKGLPVVASDVGGLAWVLRTYGGGVLVPPRDPARLAAGVLEVEAAWARFSREALAVARELTVEVQSARVAEFIRAAVGQPTAAGAAPR